MDRRVNPCHAEGFERMQDESLPASVEHADGARHANVFDVGAAVNQNLRNRHPRGGYRAIRGTEPDQTTEVAA